MKNTVRIIAICAFVASLLMMAGPPPAHAAIQFKDMPVILKTLNQVLELEPTGAVTAWENPETGNVGTIMPIDTYFREDRTPCRVYERTFFVGTSVSVVTGTACREPNGAWRVLKEAETVVEPILTEPLPPDALPDSTIEIVRLPLEPPVETRSVVEVAVEETARFLADAGFYEGEANGEMNAPLRSAILRYDMQGDPAIDGEALARRWAEN